ncbi:hypothetical protein, conserved [Eimeria praecox]|uniref:Uncharacterized protein n=1 Tax=Eimeria praecox TaxID=51316 RepID=U6GZ19_9EIME|nr:hypothetical protein, conserved [Eimeria praecox]
MLPSALPGTALPGNQQLDETVDISPSHTKQEEIGGRVSASPSYTALHSQNPPGYSNHRGGLPREALRRRSVHASLAAALSVVTVLFLLSICKAQKKREHMKGVTPRRLSEGAEDPDMDERAIVEGCLELEAEMGVQLPPFPVSYLADPSTRIMELVSMLLDAAASHGSDPGGSVAGGGISTSESLSIEGSLHSSYQPYRGQSEWEEAHGEPWPVHFVSPTEPQGASGMSPALDPSTWLEAIPSIDAEIQEQGLTEPHCVDRDNLGDAQQSTPPASVERHDGRPESEHDCTDLGAHPYVRFPVLDPGVVPRHVNVSVVFASQRPNVSPFPYLHRIRKLYAQKTLNQSNADELVCLIENLVSIVWSQAQMEQRDFRPFTIASTYGMYFLTLDSLVCAMEILGDSMEVPQWWDKFVGVINTKMHFYSVQGPAGFSRRITKRLGPALEIYKEGKRPPSMEVIALKKLLFCSRDRPNIFRKPEWIPWQNDAECQ